MALPADGFSAISCLNPQVLLHVFSYLDFRGCAALACVQQAWRPLADEEHLWQSLCEGDYNVSSLQDASEGSCTSFKDVYRSWYVGYGRKYGALLPRAKRCWDTIIRWAQQHMPEMAATIAPGASEEELDQLEHKLDYPLPLAMRVIYRLHNGQTHKSRVDLTNPDLDKSLFLGLFGGYSFYEHSVCTRLLQAHEIRPCRWWGDSAARRSYLARFAMSFNPNKWLAVCLLTGQVYAAGKTAALMCCCPPDPHKGGPKAGSVREMLTTPAQVAGADTPGDGLLRWFEEYARRLQEGWYAVRPLWNEDDMPVERVICLYPEKGPALAEATTRGVKVRSSAVLVPELSEVNTRRPQYYFSYSLRLSYSPAAGCTLGTAPETVQLHSRRWLIREDGEVVDEVRGEGVVGKYPVLRPDTPEFVYQSCSSSLGRGSMEGSLQFVPGSAVRPLGPEFDARVGRFPLEVPDFIY